MGIRSSKFSLQNLSKSTHLSFLKRFSNKSKEKSTSNTEEIESSDDVNDETLELFLEWIDKLYDPTDDLCEELTKMHLSQCVEDRSNPNFNINQLSSLTGIKFSKYSCINGYISEQNENGYMEGSFVNGVPHGFFRKINNLNYLIFFGCFIRGASVGFCWKNMIGGGLLISPNLQFSGENVIYLYPNSINALVGEFQNGIMVQAKATEVVGAKYHCQETCGVLIPEFSEAEGPIYRRDISTDSIISRSPMLQDPYESQLVVVHDSLIENAGEGLFAMTDIDENVVVCFYNGVRREAGWCGDSPYHIILRNLNYELDIPPEYASTDKYCATLGHKICHSFSPNCKFELYDHPRFGWIVSVISIKKIQAGEELKANYEYILEDAPEWYQNEWAEYQNRIIQQGRIIN